MADLPCTTRPDLFFADAQAELAVARALCGSCRVRDLCLAGALERREPHGVWGGQIFMAGVVVDRKPPRGRPRKDRVA
ncbi:WhiB family transcriptional regulator [Marmoricola sp. RAF53]|uniref:WhiB family transcriptional regulator n=1 Tax=Marmoricola sp. RAF53 TaxID=3233059 RepID=UPI003F9A5396